MKGMIERVARALYFADCGPDAFKDQYERTGPYLSLRMRTFSLEEIAAYGDKNWPHYADKARVAIAAMRRPTEAMKQAADGIAPMYDDPAVYGAEYWQVMIDAALKDIASKP